MSKFKVIPAIVVAASLLGGAVLSANAQDAAAPAAVAPATQQTAEPGMVAKIKAKFAGRQGMRGQMFQTILKEVDTDGNGSVTQDEINAFRGAKVAAADTSKDGAINLEEFAVAYHERMRSQMVDAFQRFDDDGNGSITTAELDARFGDIVAKMDRNGDGALSQADRPEGKGKRKPQADE